MLWWMILYAVGAVVFAIIELTGIYSDSGVPDPQRILGAFVFAVLWPICLPLAVIVGVSKGIAANVRRGRELRKTAND